MVETLEEAKKRRREEEGEQPSGEEYYAKSPVTFEGKRLEERYEDLKRILISTPDELGGRRLDDNRRRIREEIDEEIRNVLGIDFGQVSSNMDALEDILEQDLQNDLDGLSQNELLTVIANRLGIMAQVDLQRTRLAQVTSEGVLQNLAANIDALNQLKPYSSVPISGNITIEDANESQRVIPETENTEIPTRTVFLRADPDNNDDIYLGDDAVKPESGFVLTPGESTSVDVNFVEDMLWMASGTSGVEIQVLGLV